MTFRVATVAALALMVGLGAVSTVLFVAAFQFRPEWFANPAGVVAGGPGSASLFRWAALTDLFSYYLPNAVVALALWVALRRRGPVLAGASLVAALGYVLAGGAGAAALAMGGPPLIDAYAGAGADQATIAVVFGTLVEIVFRAIWQLLGAVLLAVWMLGTAVLVRPDQPGFGRLSLVLAASFAIGTGLNVAGFGLARDLGLGLVFVVWAGWSTWLAVLVWRRRPPFDVLDAVDASPDRRP